MGGFTCRIGHSGFEVCLAWFQQGVLCVLIIWTSDHLHLPLSPVSAHTGEVVQRQHSFSNAGHCQGWWSLPQLPHVRSDCFLPTSPLSPVGVATHHCFALSLTCCAAILWVQALLPDVSGLDYLNDGLSSDKLTSPSNLSLMNFCLWLESASSSKLHDWHFNPEWVSPHGHLTHKVLCFTVQSW